MYTPLPLLYWGGMTYVHLANWYSNLNLYYVIVGSTVSDGRAYCPSYIGIVLLPLLHNDGIHTVYAPHAKCDNVRLEPTEREPQHAEQNTKKKQNSWLVS